LIPSDASTGLKAPAGYAGTANVHEKLPTAFTSRLVPASQLVMVVPLNVRLTAWAGLNPEPFAVELLDTTPTVGKRVRVGDKIV
jgi:hypothetical protein